MYVASVSYLVVHHSRNCRRSVTQTICLISHFHSLNRRIMSAVLSRQARCLGLSSRHWSVTVPATVLPITLLRALSCCHLAGESLFSSYYPTHRLYFESWTSLLRRVILLKFLHQKIQLLTGDLHNFLRFELEFLYNYLKYCSEICFCKRIN